MFQGNNRIKLRHIRVLDGWIVDFNESTACKLLHSGRLKFVSKDLLNELEIDFTVLPGRLQECLKQLYPEKY